MGVCTLVSVWVSGCVCVWRGKRGYVGVPVLVCVGYCGCVGVDLCGCFCISVCVDECG